MKFFKNIIDKIFKKNLPKPLGRWNIDYCNKKLDTKIDLSNEDHCGPCGQYAINKKIITDKEKYDLSKINNKNI
jgi:hypothetical protein